MEIKLLCDCGQKYKFDVEPVNGRMPFTVNCPICGVDGTPKANATLASAIAAPAPPSIPVAVTATASAPPAVPTSSGALRINRPVAAAAVAAPMAAPAAYAAAVPPPPPPIAATPAPIALPAKRAAKTEAEFNMGLGIIGALLGAGVGIGLMYGFFLGVGFRFPLLGVGIGALTGYGARLLSKGTDMTLGAICGGIALVAVVGTLYLMYGIFPFISIISVIVSVSVAYRIASG